jgi:DNA repair protein NreA
MKIPRSLKFTGKDPGIIGSEKQKLLNALFEKLKGEGERSIIDDSVMGKVPNILIGSYNYPTVNTGFLASDDVRDEDNPKAWAENKDIGIKDIVLMRQSLANSRFTANVKSASRFSDNLKEVSLSEKAVDAEVFFDGKIRKEFSFNVDTLPHGPVGTLKTIDVLENPRIPFHVQRAESDIDLKASQAIKTLSGKGIDEHFLTKIVSAGNLGVKIQRKMVPTKWSITMIDDSLGKDHIRAIQGNENCEYGFFEGSYLGNYYFCLTFPGPWSFELFETYVGGLENASEYASASDYESAFGRKTYASNTSGGYYASRIAVLEYFKKKKKIGRVLMFRFITDEYWAPLGVWVVREASRNAFKGEGKIFENKDELLKHAFTLALMKFRININTSYRESKLLKEIKEQKTLY